MSPRFLAPVMSDRGRDSRRNHGGCARKKLVNSIGGKEHDLRTIVGVDHRLLSTSGEDMVVGDGRLKMHRGRK